MMGMDMNHIGEAASRIHLSAQAKERIAAALEHSSVQAEHITFEAAPAKPHILRHVLTGTAACAMLAVGIGTAAVWMQRSWPQTGDDFIGTYESGADDSKVVFEGAEGAYEDAQEFDSRAAASASSTSLPDQAEVPFAAFTEMRARYMTTGYAPRCFEIAPKQQKAVADLLRSYAMVPEVPFEPDGEFCIICMELDGVRSVAYVYAMGFMQLETSGLNTLYYQCGDLYGELLALLQEPTVFYDTFDITSPWDYLDLTGTAPGQSDTAAADKIMAVAQADTLLVYRANALAEAGWTESGFVSDEAKSQLQGLFADTQWSEPELLSEYPGRPQQGIALENADSMLVISFVPEADDSYSVTLVTDDYPLSIAAGADPEGIYRYSVTKAFIDAVEMIFPDHRFSGQYDEAAVTELCRTACMKWALLYNQYKEPEHNRYETTDFTELVTTDALNEYLLFSAQNSNILGISTSADADYQIDSIVTDGTYDIVTGIYKAADGAYGTFIFIITMRNDGSLLIDDMLYDCMDSCDMLYRSERFDDPQPGFWEDEAAVNAFWDHVHNIGVLE